MSQLVKYTVLLKDNETKATVYPITNVKQLPTSLLYFLFHEFNYEIEKGDTNPIYEKMSIEEFQPYWFGSFAAVLLLGESSSLTERVHWEKECLGTFYIKPNFPGRSAHICTGEILVNAGIRSKGIGKTLGECLLEIAPKLGYSYAMFNLVYESNAAARKICDYLGFKKLGRIKNAGLLEGVQRAVDGFIYGRDLVENFADLVGDSRIDKIRYYMETGRYPPHCDRSEKSRLRASASYYRLQDGKLFLKGREVISTMSERMQIAEKFHSENHFGINRTTAAVAERYHWARIKDTVAQVIKTCEHCQNHSMPAKRRKTHHLESVTSPTQTINPGDLHIDESLSLDLPRQPRSYYRQEFQDGDRQEFENPSGEELAIARALIQANEGENLFHTGKDYQ